MNKNFIVVRVPRALWQLFHLTLRRENLTMQAWVERTVREELRGMARHGPAPPFVVHETEAVYVARRSLELEVGARNKVGGSLAGATLKQVIARVDSDELLRLRRELNRKRVSLTQWLQHRIAEYVRAQPLKATDILSSRTLSAVRDDLPKKPATRDAVALTLLNWDDDAVVEAAADPSYGLKEAVRQGDAAYLSEILSVAAKTLEARREKEKLVTKRAQRGPKASGNA